MAIKSDRINIFVPNSKLRGGVAHYYSTMSQYFSGNVHYHYYNSKFEGGALKILFNTLFFLWSLTLILVRKPRTIVVNPSLGFSALLRDGAFCCLGLLVKSDIHIFWRGWNPEKEYLLEGKVALWCFRRTLGKVNSNIVLNSHVASWLRDNAMVCESKIMFSNTVVDDSYFSTASAAGRRAKFVILFLTRIESYKGIYEAIDAVGGLKGDVELVVAGDGSELSAVKSYSVENEMRNVIFLGHVTGAEKLRAFDEADLYLFPSFSEGMPNSVLEAMACSLPVVCTRVGAMRDFFEDGHMGYSVELPIDVNELRQRIEQVQNNDSLRRYMGEFNRQYAENRFKASITAGLLEKHYRSAPKQ